MNGSHKYQFIRNPHFWVIFLFIAFLAFIYYFRQIFHYTIPILWNLEYFELTHNVIGSLFIIPFIYAFIAFKLWGILFSWTISFCIILPRIQDVAFNNAFVINNTLLLFVPLMIGIFLSLEMRWRKRERKSLAERDLERQSFMSQIITAQENERQRIAQELHDDTVQMLYIIANQVRNLASEEDTASNTQIRKEVEGVKDAIIQVAEDVRRIMADLRPGVLDDVSLSAAIGALIGRLNTNNGNIRIEMSVTGTEQKIKSQGDVIIYRIIQEALSNVIQHSFARHALVQIEFTSELCKIEVQDDGNGFFIPEKIGSLAKYNKFGLIGMYQRIKSIGGELDIESELGKGTMVSLQVKI